MTQEIFWNNLFYGYSFIFGEQYLFSLMAFIVLALLVGCIVKKFLVEY
jgi:hypothetical protein